MKPFEQKNDVLIVEDNADISALIKQRLGVYKRACDYVQEVLNNDGQLPKLFEAVDYLNNSMELCQKGQSLQLSDIYPELTPTLLFGQSEDYRNFRLNLVEDILMVQIQKMNSFKDDIFEKSQKEQDLNVKMKYLFNTIHAINKIDYWWQLYNNFKQAKMNPWYPIPVIENQDQILHEVTNDDVAENEFQLLVDACSNCTKKRLKLKFQITLDNNEVIVDSIEIKGQKTVRTYKVSSATIIKKFADYEIEAEITREGKTVYQKEIKLQKLFSRSELAYEIELKKHLIGNKTCFCFANNAKENGNLKVGVRLREGTMFPHFEIAQDEPAIIQFFPSFRFDMSLPDEPFEQTPIKLTDVNISLEDQGIALINQLINIESKIEMEDLNKIAQLAHNATS